MRLTGSTSSTATGEQAVAWLERAAKAGLTPALLALGSVYERASGSPKSAAGARLLFRGCAQRQRQGHA